MTVLLTFLFLFSSGKVPVYSLSEALEKEIVELQQVQMNEDNELEITILNTTKRQEFRVQIEAGTQLFAHDSTLQDQVLAKNMIRYLKPGKTATYPIRSYCTEAHDRGAGNGDVFGLKAEQDVALRNLMQYLNKYNYEEEAVQGAVWVITDKHRLRGLHQADPERRAQLLRYMAELSGQPLPGYTVRYPMPQPGQPAFLDQPISIHSEHEYELTEDAEVSCRIYNTAGEEVQKVFEGMQQRRGFNRIEVTLEARDLPKGKYFTRIFANGQLLQEIQVET